MCYIRLQSLLKGLTSYPTMNPNSSSQELPSSFPKCTAFVFLAILLTPLILLQLQSLNPSLPISSSPSPSLPHLSNQTLLLSMLRHSITFLPLKDLRFSPNPTAGNTWFMSSLPDSPDSVGEPSYIRFPSASTNNRLLCLSATDPHDGARNSYALAFPEALPHNSTFLSGLTFVSESFYDYTNLWHGLAAILPFARWQAANGCAAPERWLLFHWGEVRRGMGMWVRALAEVSTGRKVRVVGGGEEAARVVCLEEAVVVRRNDGGMSNERKEEVYDMMRCRARDYCGLEREKGGDLGNIRMTLLFRVGSRSFKNETAVAEVFERECGRVEGCGVRIIPAANLTFCDQVKLMSETDILVSPHGAQMTNMIFMDKNSSVMEFFPKGWSELAGGGQYVFQWLADSAGMRHEGQWRDPNGESCPFDDKDQCFTFYKDGTIGHDEVFFSQWAAQVLQEAKVRKLNAASKRNNTQAANAGLNACYSCG